MILGDKMKIGVTKEKFTRHRMLVYGFVFGTIGSIFAMTQTQNQLYLKILVITSVCCLLGFCTSSFLHMAEIKEPQ